MKLIESSEELECWDDYQEFMKVQLKALEGSEPFFVSKEKFSFDMGGKPWNGFAVLTGPKGTQCARNLQKDGVLFRQGTCTKQGKELKVDGLDPRLVKEASKTLKKLLLGYKIAGVEDEGEGASADSAQAAPGAPATDTATPEMRAKRMEELKKLGSDLSRLLAVLNK